jgi:hypothetical protein
MPAKNNKKEEVLSENSVYDDDDKKSNSEDKQKKKQKENKGSKIGKNKIIKGKKNNTTKKIGKPSKIGERYFKLIDAKTGKSYGRYTGDTPKQAASKGYTKMIQKMKILGKTPPKHSTIYLRESTRGSARKVYGYEATRQKLETPQTLTIIDGETGEEKEIVYNYRNKIRKIPVPEQIGGLRIMRSGKKKDKKQKSHNNSKNKSSKNSNVSSKNKVEKGIDA